MDDKKVKKEYIILAVVIAALLLYLVLKKTDKVHYELPGLKPIETKVLTKIEIKKPDETLTLVKKDDKWLIDPKGYPTDETKITGITGTVKDLKLTALASKAKNYSRYDLAKDKVILVKAYQEDKVVREFGIGKTTPSNNHTFVKIEGDDNVYHAAKSFRRDFDKKTADLRDKVVMKLDKNEISEIQLDKKEGEKYLFTKTAKPVETPEEKKAEDKTEDKTEEKKTEDKEAAQPTPPTPPTETIWASADGKEGNKSNLDAILSQLADLKCDEYIEDKTPEDFKDPVFTVRLKGTKDYTLFIYEKFEKKNKEGESGVEKYPMVSSESPYPFLLSKYAAERLMKKEEDLLK